MKTRTAILSLAAACSAFGAAPALAAPAAGPGTVEVRIDDLDLASVRGRQRLDVRLKGAARQLCRTGMRGLAGRALETRCVEDAIAGARPQANRAIAQARRSGTQLALLMIDTGR